MNQTKYLILLTLFFTSCKMLTKCGQRHGGDDVETTNSTAKNTNVEQTNIVIDTASIKAAITQNYDGMEPKIGGRTLTIDALYISNIQTQGDTLVTFSTIMNGKSKGGYPDAKWEIITNEKRNWQLIKNTNNSEFEPVWKSVKSIDLHA